MFRQILPQEVLACWDMLAVRLEKAIQYTGEDYTLEDALEFLREAMWQLWALENINGDLHSLCITRLMQYERVSVLYVVIAEGQIDTRWAPAIEVLSSYAKTQGCKRLEAWGRRGWEKAAKPFGFEVTHIVLAKQL
jgi:hypothetical protein